MVWYGMVWYGQGMLPRILMCIVNLWPSIFMFF